MSIDKAAQAIRKYSRFLITAHVNLEGDSLGSQIAMKELVGSLGKEAVIIDSDRVPPHYKFLRGAADISNDLEIPREFDAAIVLDCPTLARTGSVREIIRGKAPIINIDHHISNEMFGDVNWVDPASSSAGEMVFKLFKAMDAPLEKEAALAIYIAILTDTGSFNYENTSRVTHEIAAELVGSGIRPENVSEAVYERRSVSDIKLLGAVLRTLNVSGRGDFAYIEVTRNMLRKTGADISKSEGLVNYARSIDGVKVGMLFREDLKSRGRINVSFRSKGDIDVNKIASAFGGGGHARAAGCIVAGTLKGAEKKVLAKVEEVLSGRHTDSR